MFCNHRKYKKTVVLALLFTIFTCCTSFAGAAESVKTAGNDKVPQILDAQLHSELTAYMKDIADWVIYIDLGSGILKNTTDTNDSIWNDGNFARFLMASYKITGEKKYLDEALDCLDTFINRQHVTVTSSYKEGGFWTDVLPRPNLPFGHIYFGDAGTAATALAIGYHHAEPKRQKLYLNALERYALFVTDGCLIDPLLRGREGTRSWVIKEGPDKGALPCGYYEDHISKHAYVVGTANTAVSTFSRLYELTGKEEYKKVAMDATNWILSTQKPDGEFPHNLDGIPSEKWNWPLCTLAYCTDAFLHEEKFIKDPELKKLIAEKAKISVEWLLAGQNANGSWGEDRSFDQQRSPGCLLLLNWYYYNIEADPGIAESIRRYCRFLLDTEASKNYAVKDLIRITNFVGIAVAEILSPGSTF